MFTGIITAVGHIIAAHSLGDSKLHGKRLTVETPPDYLTDVGLGDSIAINGACMTVTSVDLTLSQFTIDISAESLHRTTGLFESSPASLVPVNLEKALRAHDRLGGHIVSGHVDGVGQVSYFSQVGESWELRILASASLAKYLTYKGSVTVNGVSLTVNEVNDGAPSKGSASQPAGPTDCEISINLIPHTVQNTALRVLVQGAHVNLEIDLIARYVERMLSVNPSLRKGTL